MVAFVASICSSLGVRVSPTKVEVRTSIEILGILIDSSVGTASITPKRRDRIISEIDPILERKTAHYKEIESLTGTLAFVVRVVPHGSAFLRRLYDALKRWWPGRRRVRGSAVAEHQWWRDLLVTWDGITLIGEPAGQAEIWTDAATSTFGLGGHVGPTHPADSGVRIHFRERTTYDRHHVPRSPRPVPCSRAMGAHRDRLHGDGIYRQQSVGSRPQPRFRPAPTDTGGRQKDIHPSNHPPLVLDPSVEAE